ncbi:MAG: response regulator [Deltaproteobacteria bacterium]|nr:response regulator [Deltaproteobacteria bacterium]
MHDGRASVLVVDDNLGFVRVVRAVLEEPPEEFYVHTAHSGSRAIAWLEEACTRPGARRPAFVVLDFHLPDMDAPMVLATLRGDPRTRDVPVLVVSQGGWEEDESCALSAGACAFRVKPAAIRELRTSLADFWRSIRDADVDSLDRGPSEDGRPARAHAVGRG